MNKLKIIECINNPASIDEDATRELRDIVQEFPASPILHWLYLKGLQNQKSYLFNSALSRAAIGSPNRAQLLKWVGLDADAEETKKQKFEFKIPVETPQEVEIKTPEPKIEKPVVIKKPIAPKVQPKKEPTELPDDILAILERSKKIREGYGHEEEEAQKPTKDILEPIIENVQDIEAQKPAAIPIEEKEPETVYSKSIEEEPSVEIKEEYFEVDLGLETIQSEDEKIKEEETAFETSFEIILDEYEAEPTPAIIGEDLRFDTAIGIGLDDETAKVEDDFSSWLKNLGAKKPEIEFSEKVQEATPEVVFNVDTEVATQTHVPEPKKETVEKAHRIELIDKFLEEKPKISPIRDQLSLINLVNETEVEENQFVTETLAQIYVQQGHLNLAIEAYEILGLKYPEKMSLFADRIREIKRNK